MARKLAISEFRDVAVTFTGTFPVDGYKAALGLVEEIEGDYAANPVFVDLVATTVLIAGAANDKLYQFSLDTTIATGVYIFTFSQVVDPSTL